MVQIERLPTDRGSYPLNGWHFPIALTQRPGRELAKHLPIVGDLPAIPQASLINGADQVLVEAKPAWVSRLSVALILVPMAANFDEEFVRVASESGYGLLPVEAAIPIRVHISDHWISERGNMSIPIFHEPVRLKGVPKVLTVSADHSVHKHTALISTYWFGGNIDYGKSNGKAPSPWGRPGRIVALQKH